ncbi:MAG: 23S rRNA (guanosine(2251)-2'-O)-methyltransferase RlmB [Bacilli bacterium]
MNVHGKNVAKELLNNNHKIKKAYLIDSFDEKEIVQKLEKLGVPICNLDKRQIDKMERGNHQGIILEIEDYKFLSEKEMIFNLQSNPFIVILDHLEDPHNFGAIIRTCEAAGVDYIIIPKDRSVSINATVMKTSVGALDNVKIVLVNNLNSTINNLKEKGVWIVGTDMQDSEEYTCIDYNLPVALVIGSEGFGMSSLVKKNCDFIARIPMYGKINSLNASVAAGIMIYEVLKQRK